jgi:predicted transcriptional regulator
VSIPPKPKQVANALKSEGYTPTLIAEIMKTSIHNVKYYLSNPGKAVYVNPYWQIKFDRGHKDVNTVQRIQTTIEQKQRIQEIREKYMND